MAEYVDSPSLLEDEVRNLIASTVEKHAPQSDAPDDEAISKDAQEVVAAWAQMTSLIDVEDEPDNEPNKKPAASTLGTMIEDWSQSRVKLTIGRSFIRSDAAARDLLFDMVVASTAEVLLQASSATTSEGTAITIAGAVAQSIHDTWKNASKLEPHQICVAYAAIRASRAKSPKLYKCGHASASEILQHVPREPSPQPGPRCKRDMAAIWGCPYLDTSQPPYLVCALGGKPDSDDAALAKVQEIMGSLPEKMFKQHSAKKKSKGASADTYKYNI